MEKKIKLVFFVLILLIGIGISPVAAAIDMVDNGDFETGSLSGWTVDDSGISSITVQSSIVDVGDYAAKFQLSTSTSGIKYGYISQDIDFTSCGNTLYLSTYDHASGGTGYTYYEIFVDGYSVSLPSTDTSDPYWNSWYVHEVDLSTLCGGSKCEGTRTLTIGIGYGSNHYGDVYVDTIELYSVDPIAAFTGTPVRGKAPLSVQFTNSDLHTTHYWWSFGDGEESTLPNPLHTYTTAGGTYDVRHNAYNSGGVFDQEYKPAYITTNVTVLAAFNGTPTSGTAPLTVSFVDLSTGGAYAWNWSFGDGAVSSSRNVSHQYTSAGSYTVNLTITAPDGSDTELKSNYITATGVAEHVGLAVGGKIYDKLSYQGLNSVQMTLVNTTTPTWSLTTYTNTTGYYAFNNLSNSTSNTYVLSAVKSGYLDTATDQFSLTPSEVTAQYADKSFGMEVIGSSAGANQGVGGKYAPNIVRFTVKYWTGEPIKGVNVTAQGFESTAGNGTFADAVTILGTLFGFDFVTTPIQSQLMRGTTGDDGAIAFWMVENVNYHITFQMNGVDLVSPMNVYPKEYEYPITVQPLAVPNSAIDTNSTFTSDVFNSTHSYITVNYTDVNYHTSYAKVSFEKVINSSYAFPNYTKTYNGAAAANFSVSYYPRTHAGDQYYVTLHTINTDFGSRNETKLITIPGRQLDLRLSNNDYYAWIAIIALYLIAQMGGSKRTRDVSVIMTFFAGFLAIGGWLSITTLLLQAAIMLAVLYYIRTGEEQP